MSDIVIFNLLEDKRLSDVQRAAMQEFDNEYKLNEMKLDTRISYMVTLAVFGRVIRKDFKHVTKEDILRFIDVMKQREYKQSTQRLYLTRLKTFFKWLNGGEDYPPCVKWLKGRRTKRNEIGQLTWQNKLLTQLELQQIIDALPRLDLKAMIMTTYDTGGRKGEICNMKIGHVKFVGKKAIIELHGKTGVRTIERYKCVPFLKKYINTLPQKWREDPEHKLWRIGSPGLEKHLKLAAKKAGITKRVYLHLLRHMRATELAIKLTEAEMRYEFGWAPGSPTPSRYIHLVKSTSAKIAEEAGYSIREVQELKKKEAFKPHVCICGEVNEHDALFCNKCGIPLAEEIKKQQKDLYELTTLLVEMAEKYPPLVEALKTYKKSKQ